MKWLLDILTAHRRMRGLTAAQLFDLIRIAEDLESLRFIKEHVRRGDFFYPHTESRSGELLEACRERAKDLQLAELREHLPDPL